MNATAIIPEEQELLAEQLGGFVHDPLGAVLYGFPWGEGDLEGLTGPRKWQREVLEDIGEHFSNPKTRFKVWRGVISAGTGPGKSTLAAWLAWWGKSTYPDCRVIVTANTKAQLTTKTQPEFAKWFRMAINADWFSVHTESIKFNDTESEQTWRTDFLSWSESNPQAFAGGHNARKRIIFICDEASEISDTVFEVIERGLTDADTEIILLLIGNATRNVGKFFDVAFGHPRLRWPKCWVIDTRNVEGISLEETAAALILYGEDSDTFRVGWRGLPPRSGSSQFIDMERIAGAQRRQVKVLGDEPLVAGVDFAWGGADDNIIRFRLGLDARFIKPIKIRGELTRDPAVMTGRLADVLNTAHECADGTRRKVAMLFFDSAGIAAPVEARLRALGHKNIIVVNFGADSPEPTCAYFRDYMWEQMKQWLANGGIDADPQLEADLSGPVLVTDPKQRIKLESKDDMKARLKKLGKAGRSPDNGDALALTFAHIVLPKKQDDVPPPLPPRNDSLGWMG